MSALPSIPGLYYTAVPPAAAPSPLRTDVAGFFGRTVRGPVGVPVRVAGWRAYGSLFGGLAGGAATTYAVKGYFDNEAEIAHVVRLLGAGSQTAQSSWQAGSVVPAGGALDRDWPGASGLRAIEFLIAASSPGDWANKTAVDIRYWAVGSAGRPELEFRIAPPHETPELLTGIDPAAVDSEINARSNYLRLTPAALPAGLTPAALPAGLTPAALAPPFAAAGPRYYQWPRLTLGGGTAASATKEDFLAALERLGDQPEVALLACPDLYDTDFAEPQHADPVARAAAIAAAQVDVLTAMLTQAGRLDDRLVVIDVPPAAADPVAAVAWVDTRLRQPLTEPVLRNAAVYHPRLLVPDPPGADPRSLRCIPCSGSVAGAISRQDLRRGAYFTPANTPLEQALDLATALDADGQAVLYAGGINLLTCSPGRGLLVWGGRVLGKASPGGFVAHRRLVHLLVRAIRRVAEPLVFDTNGPELWLSLVRSITTVLLAAWRAGALQGEQASQAFQVTCDASTNPQEQIDEGMVVCLVRVAPAVPMEFITLRVAVSADGQLEVFES
jgi:hypothetical protein